VSDFSGIERPPSPSPGTSPWLLDTGASFHMTHDSSLLNSVRPVDPPVRVLTADGTPSQLLVEAFLVLPHFMSLLLRTFLSLTCSSFLVVRLSTLVVTSLSTLIPILFRIVALALCLVLAPDAMMASGSLTDFVFLLMSPLPIP
jgi:hypothetical protein